MAIRAGPKQNAVPPTLGELDRACGRFLAALPLYVGIIDVGPRSFNRSSSDSGNKSRTLWG
jgi:hypothetical protein